MRSISISSFLGLWSTYARNLSRHKLVSSMLASQTSHLFAVTINFQYMSISLPVPLFYLAGVGHGERCCHQMEHCTATDLLQPQPRQGDTHALVHGSPTCSAVTSCNIHARSALHGARPNAVQKTDAAVCTRDAPDLRTVPFRGGGRGAAAASLTRKLDTFASPRKFRRLRRASWHVRRAMPQSPHVRAR